MYTCVNCLTPSSSLYHELRSSSTTSSSISSGSSQTENRISSTWIVKLTRCKNCQHNVDHYIEHEALLIGIDLILLRLPAYRHLFFNRYPFASFCVHGYFKTIDKMKENDGGDATDTKGERQCDDTKKAFIYLSVAACLDAYHKYEALQIGFSHDSVTNNLLENILTHMHMKTNDQRSVPTVLILHLLTTSFVEHIFFFLGVALSSYYITTSMLNGRPMNHTHKQNVNDKHAYHLPDTSLISKLFLAIVLPTTFRFISIFLLIWENSHAIRILASFFVLLFQFISIHTILGRNYFLMDYGHVDKANCSRQTNINSFRLERLMPGIYPLICGMILRTLLLFIIHSFFFTHSIPFIFQCSGYEANMSYLSMFSSDWTLICIT